MNIAARNGNVEIVKLLLNYPNIDINAKDDIYKFEFIKLHLFFNGSIYNFMKNSNHGYQKPRNQDFINELKKENLIKIPIN